MAQERTYIMLKPDCVQRGLMGRVIARIEDKGYKITQAKMMTLSEEILREHYAHVADQPFFPGMLEYMTSGPVLAMIVEGECGKRNADSHGCDQVRRRNGRHHSRGFRFQHHI